MGTATGKKKIEIKLKEKEEQRMVTFSKRRQGLFKKAHELRCLTGAEIAILVFSLAGRPYTHGDPSFGATIDRYLSIVRDNNGDDSEEATADMKSWLEAIQFEGCGNVDELLLLKEELEDVKGKLVKTIS